MSSAGAPLPTMPEPGTLLDGKYRLVRQLGAGGMGLVFEADHVRLRQPFAVKVLQPQLAQHAEFQARFEREARAAALLRSPHVVRVFDVDVSKEGLTYIVMELLEGRDLAAEATEGPVSVKDLCDWMIQSCSALQEAHDQGIVHRDLKPANIFLAKVESGDRIAKVVDFGISKVEATSTSVLSVRDGTALGTPAFMPPEQIKGRRVDGRADIWALGVIIYRILGGRWPFNGSGDQQYMNAVLSDPALPFEMVRGDLPYELASVVMKALEKDVESRFQSASELGAALAPFGSGRGPVVALHSLPPQPTPSMTPPRASDIAFPREGVVPAGPDDETHVERTETMETITSRTPAQDPRRTAPLVSAPSPAAVFIPPTPVNTGESLPPAPNAHTPAAPSAPPSQPNESRSAAFAGVAAGLFAALGFGVYMFATRHHPVDANGLQPTSPPSQESASASASTTAPSASVDPAIASAQPAPTGVASAPSASSSGKRRHRPPSHSGNGAPAPESSAAPVPAVPDHL